MCNPEAGPPLPPAHPPPYLPFLDGAYVHLNAVHTVPAQHAWQVP